MSRIRGTNTSPELMIRKALAAAGMRFRIHLRTPGGRADIVFPRVRVAVFIDGCFWHGCPQHYVQPRANVQFWSDKLRTNIARDRRQTRLLVDEGWRVVRIWEHEVFADPEKVLRRIVSAIARPRRAQRQWRVVEVVAMGMGDLERRRLELLLDPSGERVVERERRTRKRPGR